MEGSKGRELRSYHRDGGIKTCDCLYRSDQSSGSALLRHGQAFLAGANAIDRDETFGDRRLEAASFRE
jgi:hypothetical protein